MFTIGSKYANWEVLSEEKKMNKKAIYECKCTCGHVTLVRKEVLQASTSKFCTKCRHKDKEINIGDKFGKWKVINGINVEEKRKHYIVQCDCGFIRVLKGIRLRFGDSLACRACGSTKHNLAHSPTYSTWESMIQRCTNPNNTNYKHYGSRGILVCDSWLEFDNFLSDMGERPKDKELDRIDNNGNYEKSNCRWVTHQENLLNRKR